MNSTFNNEDLVNNLNKNYPEIVGNAIIGYIDFYNLEQEFISVIPQTLDIKDLMTSKPEALNYLITYANAIQYGKSYFANQVVFNIIQMTNLTNYVNNIGSLTTKENPAPIQHASVEEIIGGQKGGQTIVFFMQFVVIFLLTNLANVTSVSNAISPLGEVSVSINIEKGQFNKAIGFQDELNPLNETSIIEFTKQYNPTAKFPEDRNVRLNTSDILQNYVTNVKKNTGMLASIFATDASIHSKFISSIKSETEKINELVSNVHNTLEDVCRSFTRTTDTKLPIALFELFNSKMSLNLQKLEEERNKLTAETESRIKKEKLSQLQITAPEPGIMDVTVENIKLASTGVKTKISDMLSWSFSSKQSAPGPTTEVSTVKSPSQTELIEVYNEVDDAVQKEMTTLSEQIDIEAFNTVYQEVIMKLGEEAIEAQKVPNLRIYLTAICQIKKPKYKFDETTQELYIIDPARTRTHLMVLAKNVISYYDTVVNGLPYMVNGEIVIDVPDEHRQLNMQSLKQKSLSIIEILTAYDTGLTKTLTEGYESPMTTSDFFRNIASMWINLKTNMIDSLVQFPITEREIRQQLEREQQKTEMKLREQQGRHELEALQRIQKIAHNQEANNLTKTEWKLINDYFSISTEGILGSGTVVINNLVNATSDIGNNVLINVDTLAKTGMASILSIAWSTVGLGMLFCIPAIVFLSIKSGLITSVFRNVARRLDTTPPPNAEPLPIRDDAAPIPAFNAARFPAFNAARLNYNNNRIVVEPDMDDLARAFEGVRLRGGRRYNRKVHNRKTHKHKKRRTKRVKRGKKSGKKHYTKHKRSRLTKKR